MKNMLKSTVRQVAVLTLAFFIPANLFAQTPNIEFSQLLNGSDVANAIRLNSQFDIPSSIGTVEKRFLGNNPLSFVLHVQDAHSSIEAQTNIQSILKHAYQDYGIRLVLVEGADNNLDVQKLRPFSNEEANDKFVKELTERGILTGPELFLFENSKSEETSKLQMAGVEEKEIYERNLKLFQEVYEQVEISTQEIETLQMNLSKQASKIFNKALMTFFREWMLVQESKREIPSHLEFLKKKAQAVLGVDFDNPWSQKGWPQLFRYFAVQKLEKHFDSEKAKQELQQLLDWLNKHQLDSVLPLIENPKKLKVSFRSSLEQFYEKTSAQGFSYTTYPNLSARWGLEILKEELEGERLFHEIDELSLDILHKLAVHPKEKELLAHYQQALLLKKLLLLQISRNEFESIQKEKTAYLSFLSHNLKDVFEKSIQFYQTAIERDEVMSRRLFEWMRKTGENKAAIVTGGFHSAGLEQIFEKNNISYIEARPHMSEISSEKQYLYFMTGKKIKDSTVSLPKITGSIPLPSTARSEVRTIYSNISRFSESQATSTPSRAEVREGDVVYPIVSEEGNEVIVKLPGIAPDKPIELRLSNALREIILPKFIRNSLILNEKTPRPESAGWEHHVLSIFPDVFIAGDLSPSRSASYMLYFFIHFFPEITFDPDISYYEQGTFQERFNRSVPYILASALRQSEMLPYELSWFITYCLMTSYVRTSTQTNKEFLLAVFSQLLEENQFIRTNKGFKESPVDYLEEKLLAFLKKNPEYKPAFTEFYKALMNKKNSTGEDAYFHQGINLVSEQYDLGSITQELFGLVLGEWETIINDLARAVLNQESIDKPMEHLLGEIPNHSFFSFVRSLESFDGASDNQPEIEFLNEARSKGITEWGIDLTDSIMLRRLASDLKVDTQELEEKIAAFLESPDYQGSFEFYSGISIEENPSLFARSFFRFLNALHEQLRTTIKSSVRLKVFKVGEEGMINSWIAESDAKKGFLSFGSRGFKLPEGSYEVWRHDVFGGAVDPTIEGILAAAAIKIHDLIGEKVQFVGSENGWILLLENRDAFNPLMQKYLQFIRDHRGAIEFHFSGNTVEMMDGLELPDAYWGRFLDNGPGGDQGPKESDSPDPGGYGEDFPIYDKQLVGARSEIRRESTEPISFKIKATQFVKNTPVWCFIPIGLGLWILLSLPSMIWKEWDGKADVVKPYDAEKIEREKVNRGGTFFPLQIFRSHRSEVRLNQKDVEAALKAIGSSLTPKQQKDNGLANRIYQALKNIDSENNAINKLKQILGTEKIVKDLLEKLKNKIDYSNSKSTTPNKKSEDFTADERLETLKVLLSENGFGEKAFKLDKADLMLLLHKSKDWEPWTKLLLEALAITASNSELSALKNKIEDWRNKNPNPELPTKIAKAPQNLKYAKNEAEFLRLLQNAELELKNFLKSSDARRFENLLGIEGYVSEEFSPKVRKIISANVKRLLAVFGYGENPDLFNEIFNSIHPPSIRILYEQLKNYGLLHGYPVEQGLAPASGGSLYIKILFDLINAVGESGAVNIRLRDIFESEKPFVYLSVRHEDKTQERISGLIARIAHEVVHELITTSKSSYRNLNVKQGNNNSEDLLTTGFEALFSEWAAVENNEDPLQWNGSIGWGKVIPFYIYKEGQRIATLPYDRWQQEVEELKKRFPTSDDKYLGGILNGGIARGLGNKVKSNLAMTYDERALGCSFLGYVATNAQNTSIEEFVKLARNFEEEIQKQFSARSEMRRSIGAPSGFVPPSFDATLETVKVAGGSLPTVLESDPADKILKILAPQIEKLNPQELMERARNSAGALQKTLVQYGISVTPQAVAVLDAALLTPEELLFFVVNLLSSARSEHPMVVITGEGKQIRELVQSLTDRKSLLSAQEKAIVNNLIRFVPTEDLPHELSNIQKQLKKSGVVAQVTAQNSQWDILNKMVSLIEEEQDLNSQGKSEALYVRTMAMLDVIAALSEEELAMANSIEIVAQKLQQKLPKVSITVTEGKLRIPLTQISLLIQASRALAASA